MRGLSTCGIKIVSQRHTSARAITDTCIHMTSASCPLLLEIYTWYICAFIMYRTSIIVSEFSMQCLVRRHVLDSHTSAITLNCCTSINCSGAALYARLSHFHMSMNGTSPPLLRHHHHLGRHHQGLRRTSPGSVTSSPGARTLPPRSVTISPGALDHNHQGLGLSR